MTAKPRPTGADDQPKPGLNVVAGILAILLPGLGHVYRGEVSRGVLAGVAILGMFFGGLLIGGIDVIDSREDVWWFRGQALVGPIAFVVDNIHQNRFKAYGELRRGARPQMEVYRSGYADEQRVERGGRPEWDRLSPEEIAQGMGPPSRRGLAKVNEIGTLYALVAGMLNLIVFLDALLPTPRRGETKAETGKKGGGDD